MDNFTDASEQASASASASEQASASASADGAAPLSPDISKFLTTFPFIRGSLASHVCSSIKIP